MTANDKGLGNSALADTAYDDIENLYAGVNWDRYVRIGAAVPLSTWERLLSFMTTFKNTDRVKIGSVKTFIDGSLGSQTALFHKPYGPNNDDGKEDDADRWRGLRINDLTQISENITMAHLNGLQSIVHAIGDRAIDDIISIYQSTATAGPSTTGNKNMNPVLRHRIEHVQHVRHPTGTARRIALADVIGSVQPLQIAYDQKIAEAVLGESRATLSSYRLRKLRDYGVKLAFGSDWPVVDPVRCV